MTQVALLARACSQFFLVLNFPLLAFWWKGWTFSFSEFLLQRTEIIAFLKWDDSSGLTCLCLLSVSLFFGFEFSLVGFLMEGMNFFLFGVFVTENRDHSLLEMRWFKWPYLLVFALSLAFFWFWIFPCWLFYGRDELFPFRSFCYREFKRDTR